MKWQPPKPRSLDFSSSIRVFDGLPDCVDADHRNRSRSLAAEAEAEAEAQAQAQAPAPAPARCSDLLAVKLDAPRRASTWMSAGPRRVLTKAIHNSNEIK